MPKQTTFEATTNGRTLILTRRFTATPEQVWAAWTEPRQMVHWWGPEGFTARVPQQDLRPGGQWRCIMIGPDGTEYPAKGVFREIIPGKRIVTTDEFDEGLEAVVEVPLPDAIKMTVDFAPQEAGTLLTLTLDHASEADRRKHEDMGVIDGWASSLDCLEAHLKTLE